MLNLLYLNISESFWVIVYLYLNLSDKYQLATTNKAFYEAFYHYLIFDQPLYLDGANFQRSKFLFNNVTSIVAATVSFDLEYLTNFTNLKIIDITSINFGSLSLARSFFSCVSDSIETVYVSKNNEDLANVALTFYQRKASA